jgi:hypothetical protein
MNSPTISDDNPSLTDITPPQLVSSEELKLLCAADLHELVRRTPDEAERLIRSLAHTAILHENSASIFREGIRARKENPVRYTAILAAERHMEWENKLTRNRGISR